MEEKVDKILLMMGTMQSEVRAVGADMDWVKKNEIHLKGKVDMLDKDVVELKSEIKGFKLALKILYTAATFSAGVMLWLLERTVIFKQ